MCLVLLTVLSKYSMTSSDKLTFLTNNVKRLQSSNKRIKLTEYFRSRLRCHVRWRSLYSNKFA